MISVRKVLAFLFMVLLAFIPGCHCAIEIYTSPVYYVSQENQVRLRTLEHEKCKKKLNESILKMSLNGTKEKYCPTVWDGLLCWYNATAGVVATLPCPYYIDRVKKSGKATRKCMANGEWYIEPNSTTVRSNYSGCRSIVDEHAKRQILIIHRIGLAGYTISLISLALAIFILVFFRRLHCERNTIHINLFISFFLRAVLYFPGMEVHPANFINHLWFCKIYKTVANYAIEATYTWVFIEALYLHNIIFFAMSGRSISIYIYIALGWLLPFIVSGLWALFRLLYDNELCFDQRTDPWQRDHWVLIIYPMALTLLNGAFFVNLIRALFIKVTTQAVPERNKYKKLAKAIFVLLIVFGIYQIVFIPIDIIIASDASKAPREAEMAKLYCEHIISSFQGFLVAVLFCFINSEVHAEIRRKFMLNHRRPNYDESNHRGTHSEIMTQRKHNFANNNTPPEEIMMLSTHS